MTLEEYRTLFIVVTLGLVLVVAAPVLSIVVPIRGSSKPFSELWLSGPDHLAKGYPFNVRVGEEHSVSVGVVNHLGCSEYYLIYVKLRNQTQPLPDISNSMPSSLSPLHEFRFFVADGETWESLLVFKVLATTVQDDSIVVGGVSINGFAFPVNRVSMWDSENDGFYYQLFFELWLFNGTSRNMQFHNRFVGIWLNVTSS